MKVLKAVALVSIFSLLKFSAYSQPLNGQRVYVKFKKSEGQTFEKNNILTVEMIQSFTEVKNVKRISSHQKSANARIKRKESKFLERIHSIEIDNGKDANRIIQEWREFDNVEEVVLEPNVHILYVPNDPDIDLQNQLAIIQAFEAWDVTKGSEEVIIGISDTGVDYNHEDLQNNRHFNIFDPVNGIDDDGNGYIDDYIGIDIADDDSDPISDLTNSDDRPHGSRVAGIASGSVDNSIGIAGVGFNTKYFPIKVFRSEDGISNGAYESIVYAADLGLDVINLSWGADAAEPSSILQDIIDYAVLEKDLVVIAAAGNTNAELNFYPASFNHVLSVGATNASDEKAGFATFSYNIDLTAPGQSIYSTVVDDGYGSDSGTSYSSPMVAGTAALVRDVFPHLDAVQVMEQIRMTSDDVYHVGSNSNYVGMLGKGRLNVHRAVIEENVASLRMSDFSYSSSFQESLFFGDTVTINLRFVNILRDLDGAQVQIGSSSPYVEILNDQLLLGALATYDTTSSTSIKVLLSENTPASERIIFRMDYTDIQGYADFQYFEFTTASNEILIDNGVIETTVTSHGDLGLKKGLSYQGESIASMMGFMIGNHADSISDNMIQDYINFVKSADFEESTQIKKYKQDSIDQYVRNIFSDEAAENTNGYLIEQEFLIWEDSENIDFLISEYYITNTTSEDRFDLKVGLFVDFGLEDTTKNFIRWDLANEIGYAESNVENALMAGVVLLSDHDAIVHAIDLFDENQTPIDFDGSFSESDKYSLLNIEKIEAGGLEGYDVAMTLAANIGTLEGKASTKVAFAYVFGNNLNELIGQAENAKIKYESFLETPSVNWEVSSCHNVTIALGNEDAVALYTDPLGLELIDTGLDLSIPGFSEDSSFYYQELIEGYSSDIYRLNVRIANPQIEFRTDPEVLYLGDIPGNRVQFIDESLGALEWSWIFDNGNFSSLKNPKTSFNTVGSYNIELSIVTTVGCEDSDSKTFEVKERGEAPIIEDQLICSGETATITASNSTSLNFYENDNDIEPFHSGDSWTTEVMVSTQTFYVSSIEGAEESVKVPVLVEVDGILADFEYAQDTLEFSSSELMSINDQSDQAIEISWFVNDNSEGSDSSWLLDYSALSEINIKQIVTSQIGCIDSLIVNVPIVKSTKPGISDELICIWEDVLIVPGFGEKFVFYSDEAQTNIIGKGKTVFVESILGDTTFYITNITDYIESDPVAFNIQTIGHDPIIMASPDSLVLSVSKIAQFFIEENDVEIFNWYLNDMFVETARSPTLTFDTLGNYDVKLISTHEMGCQDTSYMNFVVYEVLNAKENRENLNIYPIPALNNIMLSGISAQSISNLKLFNISGQEFFIEKAVQQDEIIISLSTLLPGMYIISGENNGVFFKQKFVKE
ncbi:MAG: S8 family serine peptidase [Reichenbachiella sp.]